MPYARHHSLRPRLAAVLLLAVLHLHSAINAARAQGPSSMPASAPAEQLLPPPADILADLDSGDPERHIEGFRAWHAWRGSLSSAQRVHARNFIARDRYFQVLADAVIYDVEEHAVRLTACKLLARFGDQRVFPIFLWSVSDDYDTWHGDPVGGLLTRMFYQPAYIKWYFGRHGDPTVIEFLPPYAWWQEIDRIRTRWADKSPPAKNWEPLRPEDFVSALADSSPVRRRLAVRALATCGKSEAKFDHDMLAPLLDDPDPLVRLTVARVLSVVPCPAMRGPLKRLVEDDAASDELRAASLIAVARCGVARNWTAEWIVECLPEWPEALDSAAQKALVNLSPPPDGAWGPYRDFLGRRLEDARNPRVRKVLQAAIGEIP